MTISFSDMSRSYAGVTIGISATWHISAAAAANVAAPSSVHSARGDVQALSDVPGHDVRLRDRRAHLSDRLLRVAARSHAAVDVLVGVVHHVLRHPARTEP